MASSLPTEKLDRTNYASWSYKMHQYLLRHGYWSYVDGANDTALEPTYRDFPTWEQSVSRVLYCFASCVGEQLLSYVRDAQTPKGAWENLKKVFAASTTARWFRSVSEVWRRSSERSERLCAPGRRRRPFSPGRGEPRGCVYKHARRQQNVVHGGRGEWARNGGGRRDHGRRHRSDADSNSRDAQDDTS